MTNNGLFFHSTNEKEAFAGSIINWLNSDGTNAGHVGLVDQNDTATMTFCAHTRCRRSCPWTGEKVDFYIPIGIPMKVTGLSDESANSMYHFDISN